MLKFIGSVCALLAVLFVTGFDVPGIDPGRVAGVVTFFATVAVLMFCLPSIIDRLFGDHREVRVGQEANWVPTTSSDPSTRTVADQYVVYGKPVMPLSDPFAEPTFLRTDSRSGGQPLDDRKSRAVFSAVKRQS